MSTENSNSLTIFTFGKPEEIPEIIEEEIDDTDPKSIENEESQNIMCIIFKGGKIGSAYYNDVDHMLYIYEEMPDFGPDYLATVGIYREVNPKYLLTFGSVANNFVKVLIDLINGTPNTTVSSDSVRTVPSNMSLLFMKDYDYNLCKLAVAELELISNRGNNNLTKNEVHLHSRVNFDDSLSVHALGSLLKFLKKKFGSNNLQYLEINQMSRKNYVLIDNATFRALQVFSPLDHEASFKRGSQSSTREGYSIYSLFSSSCKSKIGMISLKDLLINPINDLEILTKRLNFLDFLMHPKQRELVEELQKNLKFLCNNLNLIISGIGNMMANTRDWYQLYKTIYHIIDIRNIIEPYKQSDPILEEFYNSVTEDLIELGNALENGLDFKSSAKRGRPVIRFGLDEELDKKKLRQQDIYKDVGAAARLAVGNLPDFLKECSVVYLPEMGHLIVIKEWEEGCDPDKLEYLDFKFVFNLRGRFHYKNPLCVELDRRLGDINGDIIDHENRILRRLSGYVCKFNKNIRDPLKIIGLIDCLISIAKVSGQNSFIRPNLNTNGVIEIKGGRHPLMEQICPQYQTHNFFSGGQHSRMKIVTGPNGSGKTVYLKEVALVTFLAHTGTYIPAEEANIGLTSSIHSRLHTKESALFRLSSFMIDITQTTKALNIAASNSLILLDEFGRGTCEEDGITVLSGVLKYFLNLGRDCPHIIVSTHFQQIINFLPETPLIENLKMDFTVEHGNIYFLFKVTKGVSRSYALDVAERCGLDRNLVKRAKEILDCIRNNKAIQPLPQFQKKMDSLKDASKLDIPKPDIDKKD